MRLFVFFFMILLLYACGGPASKPDGKIIFAISASQGSLQHQTAEEFTRRVNEKLPIPYQVVFYGSSQLGKDKDLMQKLKLGTVHLTLPSSIMSTYIPEFGFFEMPFLIRNREHVSEIERELFWPLIAPKAADKGYEIIGLWENGFRHLTNNKRPIYRPEDLSGIKLRIPRSNWRVSMFREWGGNPTPMAFSEVFVALQTGVIDGQENPLTNIYAGKLHEVQEYLSLSSHVYVPAYLTAGVKSWAKFPNGVQEVLEQTAKEVKTWMYEKAQEQELELVDLLAEKGMKINQIDDKQFRRSSHIIYQSFTEQVEGGEDIIERCLRLSSL